MTSNASSTTRAATDAVQEAPFDPSARQFDSAGRSFVDFHAALCGEADPQDSCNAEITRLIREGRSEAFCREYRKGWDSKAAEVRGQSIAYQIKRGDWQTPQAIRQGFNAWKPGYSDRRNIAEAAEAHASKETGRINIGAAAWAVGTPDFGQINTRIVTARIVTA